MTEQEYNEARKRIEQIIDSDDLQDIYELDNLFNLVCSYELVNKKLLDVKNQIN